MTYEPEYLDCAADEVSAMVLFSAGEGGDWELSGHEHETSDLETLLATFNTHG